MNSGKHLTHSWGLSHVPGAIPGLWLLAWYHGGMSLGLEGSPVLLSLSRYRPAWHALQFPDPWGLVLCLVLERPSK